MSLIAIALNDPRDAVRHSTRSVSGDSGSPLWKWDYDNSSRRRPGEPGRHVHSIEGLLFIDPLHCQAIKIQQLRLESGSAMFLGFRHKSCHKILVPEQVDLVITKITFIWKPQLEHSAETKRTGNCVAPLALVGKHKRSCKT